MANELGESGKSKIYIVTYDNPRPSNGTNGDFIDYYGYFISWTIKHKLNQLASFEGEAYGISDATKRSHFNANNYIYVMSGSDLVSKFVIEKPIYDTRGSTKVTAIQSSGANLLTAPFIKNLARTATAKKKFKNSDAIDVFTDTDGILIDGNGDLVINPTIDPSLTDYISISLNKHNRINAVNRACNLFKAEWTITHGENVGPNPFSEGDFITIQSRLGLDSSAYTFYLSGTNTNATLASGTEQIDTATNHVILKGTDINGKQIQTELFDASGNSTTLNLDLDAWLDGDIDPSETTINIKPGHNFVGLTNFYVKIDNEVIKISSITGNVMTVSERGSDGPLSDNTIPTSHKDGSDVVLLDNGKGDAPLGGVRLYTAAKPISSSHHILVGSEHMFIIGLGGLGYYIVYRQFVYGGGAEDWNNTYAHSAGSRVVDYGDLSSYYTVDSPDTTTDNSIRYNGDVSYSYTANSSLSKDALDKKAFQILTTKKLPEDGIGGNEVITIEVSDPYTVWSAITSNGTREALGCAVTLSNCDSINIDSGEYRIVEYEYSWPGAKLILYLNKPNVRGYADGSSNFAESFEDSMQEDAKDPISLANDAQNIDPSDVGLEDGITFGQKKIDGVVVPLDAWGSINPQTYMQNDFDSNAASVGYVRAATGGYGYGLWVENVALGKLMPYRGGLDVVPYDSTNNLGKESARWTGYWGKWADFWLDSAVGVEPTVTIAREDGNYDDLWVGWSGESWAPELGYNFRVSSSNVSIWNGPLGFHYLNPNRYIWFNYPTNTAGFRIYSDVMQYKDVTGSWTSFASLASSMWNRGSQSGYSYLYPTQQADRVWIFGGASHSTVNDNILLVGKYSGNWDQYNLRVSNVQVGIYNGDINMNSNGGVQDLGYGHTVTNWTGGISFKTYNNLKWLLYGDTADYLVLERLTISSSSIFNMKNTILQFNGPVNYLDMNSHDIKRVQNIYFKSYDGNNISDSGVDLKIQGRGGIYLGLEVNNGGVIIGKDAGSGTTPNVSTLRPFVNSTGIPTVPATFAYTNIGDQNFYWGNLYVRQIYLNGVARNSWPSFSTPTLGQVLQAGNIASTHINMNNYSIYGLSAINFINNNYDTIFDRNNGDSYDLIVQGQNGIYLQLNTSGGGVVLGSSNDNISMLRPFQTDSSYRTDLGASYSPFKDLYVQKIWLSGVGRTTWPSGGDTNYWSLSGSALSPTNGGSSIDMNNDGIFNCLYLQGNGDMSVSTSNDLFVGSDSGDVQLYWGDNGACIYTTTNIGGSDYEMLTFGSGSGIDGTFFIFEDDFFINTNTDAYLVWDSDGDSWSLKFTEASGIGFVRPQSDCDIDLGRDASGAQYAFRRIRASDIYADTNSPSCDIAELQFVDDKAQIGDIVELADWDNDEANYFAEELKICEQKDKLGKPCKITYYGMQGKWKKAQKGSTKCPSVISTAPAVKMGSTSLREELYKSGKMKYVSLSGSVPNVYIQGEFKSGDIIVSAGSGYGVVNNDASWSQIVGYAKRSGNDERCEIWVR